MHNVLSLERLPDCPKSPNLKFLNPRGAYLNSVPAHALLQANGIELMDLELEPLPPTKKDQDLCNTTVSTSKLSVQPRLPELTPPQPHPLWAGVTEDGACQLAKIGDLLGVTEDGEPGEVSWVLSWSNIGFRIGSSLHD